MTKRMLIDASHAEETRVAILDGNRLEAFDFESANRKQLKGNIYLARVTRVEPSLQACFVEYGGNRQGFLAFSEIHPDYYQIPIADREALMEQEEREVAEAEGDAPLSASESAAESAETENQENTAPTDASGESQADESEGQNPENSAENSAEAEESASAESMESARETSNAAPNGVETMGGDEAEEARQFRKMKFYRRYKIQEVIKRRQILLIQVVKEERGMKGAALTTYISLPGRYCVLMPNSARSGVSRKISNYQDRRRMKSLISSLDVPDGMAVILRTAGADRPKTDIKRDSDYLLKLWDEVREKTLKSSAPALIYEEGNLVKRAIRDLYGRDIEQVYVEGDEGYKTAKALMKVLTPSHAKRVQQFKDKTTGLFQKYQVESQIDSVHDNRVELPSGGYIIINQTEALVAVDVNSGRSTRERNIEETAYRTNIEAAEEIGRQMRLRDLAGLIVIDFIDMENHRNKVDVERRFKEAVRKDRARMQIGRISHFGLLELTRQRLRPSVLEGSSSKCPTCNGLGTVRSTESSALTILRAIEEDLIRRKSSEIKVFMASHAALYLLNHKRAALAELEAEQKAKIILQFDDTLVPPAHRIERIKALESRDDDESARDDREPIRHNRPADDDNESSDESGDADDGADATSDDNDGNDSDGNSEQPQNASHNRGHDGGGRRDRFQKRGRGGRNRGGRDRFRGRNRNRPDRDRDPNQNQAGGGEPQDRGNFEPAGENLSAAHSRTVWSSQELEQDSAQSFAPKSYTAEPKRDHGQALDIIVADRAPDEDSKAPENVELITGTPSNPKRGWWRKLGQ